MYAKLIKSYWDKIDAHELFGNEHTEINIYVHLDAILEMENWTYEKF